MNRFLSRWLFVSFLNLFIVALLGVTMRYKIAYYLPFVEQKHLLLSHSHFAFIGWITQTLMVLLVHFLSLRMGDHMLKKYRLPLYANLLIAYGMMASFIAEGYSLLSIIFSTGSIIVFSVFAIMYWMDLNKIKEKKAGDIWIRASFVFGTISSLGAFFLAYLMANKIMHQDWQLASIYFYLHFQYNGWFMFAGIGLFMYALQSRGHEPRFVKPMFWLFALACIPAYLLSALWLPFPNPVYWLLIISVIAQLIAWVLFIKSIRASRDILHQQFSGFGRVLLMLSFIAFSLKILLQSGSVHPALSQLSYSFRPIIIGYLHLVLLAVTSLFLIGYIAGSRLVAITAVFKAGIIIFVAGIIINELLLMVQGISSINYTPIRHLDDSLFIAACILFTGALLMAASFLTRKQGANSLK